MLREAGLTQVPWETREDAISASRVEACRELAAASLHLKVGWWSREGQVGLKFRGRTSASWAWRTGPCHEALGVWGTGTLAGQRLCECHFPCQQACEWQPVASETQCPFSLA